MKLAEWLTAQGKSQREFAVEIGISEGYLSQICLGRVRGPSLGLAVEIERKTDGAVTAAEMLAERPV